MGRDMRRLHNFVRYPPADRRLLVQAAFFVGLMRLGLWVLPFRIVLRLVEHMRGRTAPGATISGDMSRRVGWAVRKVARSVPGASCLTQALATQILLSRYGLDGRLRIGVARATAGKLAAHAWIESEGVILVGNLPNLGRFVELPPLELARS